MKTSQVEENIHLMNIDQSLVIDSAKSGWDSKWLYWKVYYVIW